ncbi:zinc finger protein 354B [Centropristis striata]|uniref:zinc finger protein 354B n=1 Tax=Centropristis striata TaxID=184440 RepID=UPI0027DF332C|nr:zinc finger protein 354B [Centropristis striata]
MMADLDTLIVTFQTQLSDVMETVVKTAMYEVTRLVEDGFLEEVQRRNREVETLRRQLQRAERKLSEHKGAKSGRCVDCAKEDVELCCEAAGERPREQQDDMFGSCVKEEGECVDRWALSHKQEVIPESTQAPDSPSSTNSPERKSETTDEEDVLPAADVKLEEVNKPSCSSVRWSAPLDGEAGSESCSAADMTEVQQNQTQENSEELLRDVIKQDLQISAPYVFSEDQEETYMATDPSLEGDGAWADLTVTTAGLLQNNRLATEKECDPAKSRGPLKQTEHELSSCVTADVDTASRDQMSASASPQARPPNSEALGVTIKQEVIVDSDECVESQRKEKKPTKTTASMASFSVKQHRLSSEALKQNHISQKATVQETHMKLHPKAGSGLRLHAAIQHLHRPMKKISHTHSHSTSTTLPVAHSNLNPLTRTPSTSKAAPPPPPPPPPPLSANRTSAPWVSIKTHLTANSHHANPLPHPDSHPHAGPRHLLRCGQCGKCFPHPSNLKAHLQTHTGERPFCCSLCGRSFTKLSNLKAHRRVHTGERPYCCLACGKRFTQKCNLKRHQRIHLDV